MADVVQPAFSADAAGERSRADWVKILLGFGGMIIGQFMAILDIQIVAASLPQIQAGVGASADEIAWVQTIYLLSEVVIIPLTAYLTKLFGTRPFFLAACAGFMATSALTGLCSTIETMILMRALQGLCAGAMIPPVFATAMSIFPPERRLTANVAIGVIVSLAPTIGPTLGGHMTEALNWRWLFFINVPAGLVVLLLVGRYGGFDKGDPRLARGIDWFGLGAMTVFLLSMQYVLEEGASDGWLQDDLILWLTVLAVISSVTFVWRQLSYHQPIVSLAPFRDRNFTIGMGVTLAAGLSLFGAIFILPLYLAQILRYSPGQVGTTLMVSGVTMLITAPLIARLGRYLDPRLSLFIGFGVTAYGLALGARATQDWGFHEFAFLQVVRAIGTVMAMTSAQQLTISTLPVSLMKEASGLMNLIRNVGGAIGLALLSTVLSHESAAHFADLTAQVSAADAASADLMAGLTARMQDTGIADPEGAGRKAFAAFLHQKALMLAFNDAFAFLATGCAIAALLGLFARSGNARPAVAEEIH